MYKIRCERNMEFIVGLQEKGSLIDFYFILLIYFIYCVDKFICDLNNLFWELILLQNRFICCFNYLQLSFIWSIYQIVSIWLLCTVCHTNLFSFSGLNSVTVFSFISIRRQTQITLKFPDSVIPVPLGR